MTHLTPEVQEVALTLMEGLDCPRSLTVAILLRYCEWDQLTQLEVDPKHHCSAQSYLDAASATDFLRKYQGFTLPIDLESLAFEKWLWAEQQCYLTNRRLYGILDFKAHSMSPVQEWLLEFIEQLRKNVRWLIGNAPPEVTDGAFGPGATVSDSSRECTILHKLSSQPTLTSSALYYLVPWTGTYWASACAGRGDVPSIVRGNSYFTVDKTARSRRSCAKEPSLNAFYQLGLGRELRRRLKKRGIDLTDGQDVHRRVACSASLSGEFCTIDLTSASDCLCRALVELCVPPRWHEALNDLRSSHTKVKGKWYRLEKFSSMGNGFTFELETVVFTAICMTVMGDFSIPGVNLWVYGDDIIIPREHYEGVVSALKYFGFTPNPRKSFSDGYFRESCGGDFFNGVAVRPYFLKEVVNEPQQLISMANGIRRMARQNHLASSRWPRLLRSWFRCLDYLPTSIRRCRGPEALGDLCIHDEEERWSFRWRANGYRYIRVYRPARFRGIGFDRFGPDVQFAAALYGVSLRQIRPKREGFDTRSVVPRDGVLGYKVGWVPYS